MPWDRSSVVARIRKFAVVPLVYLILPNLPVWLFERKMALSPHGYVNVECLLVGILAAFVPRLLTFVLLLLEVSAAFIYLICYTYQFSLTNLFASARYASLLPSDRISLVFAAFAFVISVCILIAFFLPRADGSARALVAAVLLGTACLSVSIDTLDGRNPVLTRDVSYAMPRLSISPLVELGRRGMFFRAVEVAASRSRGIAMPSASAVGTRFLGKASSTESPNVVLVVVESWGLSRDSDLADQLTAGYHDPAIDSEYRVSFGTAPFAGLTVPGEARELCQSEIGFGILDLTQGQDHNCLPALFHAHGYQDVSVHGYAGEMFQRVQWYKTIGFDQRWFGPDLARLGLSSCDGAFPGICDADVADWIGNSLLADTSAQPRFIYWVTLNSHLPVNPSVNLATDASVCNAHAELQNSTTLCSWFRLVLQVHRSVQRIALDQRTRRPTVFILVGDHAPPFAKAHLRTLFSDSQVPYVILTPRDRGSEDQSISHGGS
jgi:hypothetical protein